MDYRSFINELLNRNVINYEEIYYSFSRMMLTKINNKRIILLYDDERKLSFLKRYLSAYNLSFEKEIKMQDRDNPYREKALIDLLDEIKKDRRFVLITTVNFQARWWNSIQYYWKSPKYWLNYWKFKRCKKVLNNIDYFEPKYYRSEGHFFYEYVKENVDRFVALYDCFDDEESVTTLNNILEVGITNGVWSQPNGNQFDKYWELYKHLDDECWVNCGSATGDTIIKFILSGYKFEKIYAYEGDTKIFDNLKAIVSEIPDELRTNIEMINQYIGINNESSNFDNMFKDKRVTLINMDIEGAEMDVLRGCSQLIKKQRPVLAVCAYHNPSDLVEIPKFINETVEDYKIFLRKYIGYTPSVYNEYIYYCVPAERVN